MQTNGDDRVQFDPEFNERLQRNVDTVSKFDQPFALYWLKSNKEDPELNRSLAQLCRQEDVVCRYRLHVANMSRTTRRRMHEEALWLLERWEGALEPGLLARRRRILTSACRRPRRHSRRSMTCWPAK